MNLSLVNQCYTLEVAHNNEFVASKSEGFQNFDFEPSARITMILCHHLSSIEPN